MSQSRAISRALESGFVFDAKAFEAISKLPPGFDVEGMLERVLVQKEASETRVISEADLGPFMPVQTAQPQAPEYALAEPADVEVMSDPTMAIAPLDANEGYGRLFSDRYSRLMTMVRSRPDTRSAVGTMGGRAVQQGQRIKVAGLLSAKVNRRTAMDITIDDPNGTLKLTCQGDAAVAVAQEAPLDSMVVADVSRARSGQLYVNSIVLPDVPDRKPIATSHRVYAVLLSDLHIGSKMFLEEDFRRFVLWLNGKLGDVDIVSRVKYLVIAGDLVDGVGVYPGQEYQLSERNPKEQYASAARLLEMVPGHIQIIISPGNHDVVRQALPQPAVSLDVAEALYGMPNVRWVGDPAYVKLHGTTFLIYHGKSLDDVIATTPDLSYGKPATAMKLLLRARHLAPTYGKRTALSPEQRDYLVVDPVPDVLHCGHVHAFDEMDYRGTLIVNSGTWQAQTSFQANMGVEPTPSVIPVVDLSNLRLVRRYFGPAGFGAA